MNHQEKFWILSISVAVLGGVIKSYRRIAQGKKPPRLALVAFNMLMGGFCGLMVLFLAHSAGLGSSETCFLSGMAGYAGGDLLDSLSREAMEKVKKFLA